MKKAPAKKTKTATPKAAAKAKAKTKPVKLSPLMRLMRKAPADFGRHADE